MISSTADTSSNSLQYTLGDCIAMTSHMKVELCFKPEGHGRH